jgi:dihydroorotase
MIARFTTGPAKILNLPHGTLREGAPGDVTLLDPDRAFEVDPGSFESRGRNTPFGGWKLKGCAAATIVAGRVVMNRIGGATEIMAGEGAGVEQADG